MHVRRTRRGLATPPPVVTQREGPEEPTSPAGKRPQDTGCLTSTDPCQPASSLLKSRSGPGRMHEDSQHGDRQYGDRQHEDSEHGDRQHGDSEHGDSERGDSQHEL